MCVDGGDAAWSVACVPLIVIGLVIGWYAVRGRVAERQAALTER
ncbi:hypothetical protein ACFRAO_05860 [Streptomyces sp. NPDC056656]